MSGVDLSRYSPEEREIIAICQRGRGELTEAWIEMCLEQARAIGELNHGAPKPASCEAP